MLAYVHQTAKELMTIIGPTLKHDLSPFSLLSAVVDARSQSPRSYYAYLLLNENQTMLSPSQMEGEHMPLVLANTFLPILSTEIDNILNNRSLLWPVAADFLYSLVESSHVPLGSFHITHTMKRNLVPEHRTSIFRPQQSLFEYLCHVGKHPVQSRWLVILFWAYPAFRWILSLIISAFLLGCAEGSVRQMGAISTNPSIHHDFTGIEFYSFKEIEERFCQTCITKHRASSQVRRAISGRTIKSARSSRTITESTRSSRAPSTVQTTAIQSQVSSPQHLGRSRASSTAHYLCPESTLTITDLEYHDNDIYSTRLHLTLTLPPSDLSLSLAELLHAMQRKAKKQGYLSLLKSSLQSIMSNTLKEQQWKLPSVTLLSVFEPFCNLCIEQDQRLCLESPSLTHLIMKRLGMSPDEGFTWKARTLSFNPDNDKMLFTVAAARYYDRFGEYLYSMDRKLAKFNLAPVILGPAFYGYRFFIDRALVVEKLGHWNTINLSKLIRTTSLDGAQSSDMTLFASSGSKTRINRQIPLEFVFMQLILTVLQQWGELKKALFDPLSDRVERALIHEFEYTVTLHALTPIEELMQSTIEMCPLLQQHMPTLVLLSNAIEALERRFFAEGVDVREKMLSIKAYILQLIENQLEIIHNDFQILLEFKYNQVQARRSIRNKANYTQSFTDLIAQPEAYAIGCLFESLLSLHLGTHNPETLSHILQEYANKITHLLKEILRAFFEYSAISAQLTLTSEVDQLIRQLSECHILCSLMSIGANSLDTDGHIANAITQQIKGLFTKLCAVLTEKGVVTRIDQIEYLRALKRSHMIHKQLLIRLEHIETL